MRILYTHMVVDAEGSQVHAQSFAKAFRELGDHVIENQYKAHKFAGGKESWTLFKRALVRAEWVFRNMYRLIATWVIALWARPDVLLFRFEPLHEFFSCICLLSAGYPVVLEINAVRSIENHHGRPGNH